MSSLHAQSNTSHFMVGSSAFKHNEPIPSRYTCKGKNISPALTWHNVPANTKSFVLIVDDPDAPARTWVHWVVYNIPATVTQLPEYVSIKKLGGLEGVNSSGNNRYDGPCPPSGTHRYFFKLYALDILLSLERGATKEQVLDAMQGHVLAQTELMGIFSK